MFGNSLEYVQVWSRFSLLTLKLMELHNRVIKSQNIVQKGTVCKSLYALSINGKGPPLNTYMDGESLSTQQWTNRSL